MSEPALPDNQENRATPAPSESSAARWRYRLAFASALMTFPLIFIGGMVTSKDAGMAVPDWPTTFGFNMFTFPASQWVGNILYEHGHRLLGSVVGFLTLSLTIFTAFTEPRPWVRKLTWGALAAVIAQGVLGGLRVELVNTIEGGAVAALFGLVHGCFAQAFFVYISFVAYAHSAEFKRGPLRLSPASFDPASFDPNFAQQLGGLRRLSLATLILVFGQLALGALVRHINRGVYGHMSGALLVSIAILGLAAFTTQRFAKISRLKELGQLLPILLTAQLLLGLGSWLSLPEMGWFRSTPNLIHLIPTAHQALGAILLLSLSFLALRAQRIEILPPAIPLESQPPEDADKSQSQTQSSLESKQLVEVR